MRNKRILWAIDDWPDDRSMVVLKKVYFAVVRWWNSHHQRKRPSWEDIAKEQATEQARRMARHPKHYESCEECHLNQPNGRWVH